jgi:hypothetical protein
MSNENPLPKQLVALDLRKGVNERERPETADVVTTLTRVDNLIQDQTGSYIKRPGTPYLGGNAGDDLGQSIGLPSKLYRFKSGLGMVTSSGKLYDYLENQDKFRVKCEYFPALTPENGETILASGQTGTADVSSIATSTRYQAIVHNSFSLGGSSTLATGRSLSVYDRASGSVVAHYVLKTAFGFIANAIPEGRVVFVGDRYLHVYATGETGVGVTALRVSVIDTQSAFPATGATFTYTTVLATGAGILDVGTYTDRSFVLSQTSGNPTIYAVLNTAAVANSSAVGTAISIYCDSTRLWVLTSTQLGTRSPTNVATVVNALSAHGQTVSGGWLTSDGSNAWVCTETNTTFGSTTLPQINVFKTNGTMALVVHGAILGWKRASAPFPDLNAPANVFIHATKFTGLTLVTHEVINLSAKSTVAPAGGSTYTTFGPAAMLEPYVGLLNSTVVRYFSYDSYRYGTLVPLQTARNSVAYASIPLKVRGHSKTSSIVFGGNSYISGGVHTLYSGQYPYEVGFHDMPYVNSQDSGVAGLLVGSYKYVAVFRHNDETGAVTYSRTSTVSSLTVNLKQATVKINAPHVTLRESFLNGSADTVSPQVAVELYRTKSGGTQYYLVATAAANSAGQWTVTDNVDDTTLGSQPLMYRQPGTAGAAVDRYPPPGDTIVCQHKDRIFTTDAYGSRVYYSSFFVDGETAWFNPVFSFFVHGGSGPITALVSMDGRLFVFKRDGIFVVDGDGPPEGGVSGNEYSPPQRLATEYGCVDARSVVVTPDGIFYRSPRGAELLTRSLQVIWVGERVQNTLDANPVVCGATLDDAGRVRLCVAASDPASGNLSGITGAELVYDMPGDCWTAARHTGAAAVANAACQDMIRADLAATGETIVQADPAGVVIYESWSTGLDRGQYFSPWVIETAWLKTGIQARQRITRFMFLGKSRTNHAIKISAAFNYVDTYTQFATWQPDQASSAIEELLMNVDSQQVLSAKFRIEELVPTDTVTYPVGTGLGTDVLGLTVEVAPKTGAPKLVAEKKA